VQYKFNIGQRIRVKDCPMTRTQIPHLIGSLFTVVGELEEHPYFPGRFVHKMNAQRGEGVLCLAPDEMEPLFDGELGSWEEIQALTRWKPSPKTFNTTKEVDHLQAFVDWVVRGMNNR